MKEKVWWQELTNKCDLADLSSLECFQANHVSGRNHVFGCQTLLFGCLKLLVLHRIMGLHVPCLQMKWIEKHLFSACLTAGGPRFHLLKDMFRTFESFYRVFASLEMFVLASLPFFTGSSAEGAWDCQVGCKFVRSIKDSTGERARGTEEHCILAGGPAIATKASDGCTGRSLRRSTGKAQWSIGFWGCNTSEAAGSQDARRCAQSAAKSFWSCWSCIWRAEWRYDKQTAHGWSADGSIGKRAHYI